MQIKTFSTFKPESQIRSLSTEGRSVCLATGLNFEQRKERVSSTRNGRQMAHPLHKTIGAIGYSTTHKNNLHLENKKEKLCNKDKRLTDRNYACTQVKHAGQIMH